VTLRSGRIARVVSELATASGSNEAGWVVVLTIAV